MIHSKECTELTTDVMDLVKKRLAGDNWSRWAKGELAERPVTEHKAKVGL